MTERNNRKREVFRHLRHLLSEVLVKIAIPKTSILQTDIYFRFIEYNRLEDLFSGNAPDHDVINRFLGSKFPPEYAGYLAKIVTDKDEGHLRPMAVRSSSMVEDGERFSFSGIFSTIFVPNQSQDLNVRVAQLEDAIKFVYAGMATREVRAYKAEMGVRGEDGMGIMIQNVVGRHWNSPTGNQLYYPEGAYALFSFNNYAREGINEKDGI